VGGNVVGDLEYNPICLTLNSPGFITGLRVLACNGPTESERLWEMRRFFVRGWKRETVM
jgi:hypothetical protein